MEGRCVLLIWIIIFCEELDNFFFYIGRNLSY